MNLTLLGPELVLVLGGLALLLVDLAVPAARRHLLGYATAGGVALLCLYFVANHGAGGAAARAFGGMFVLDGVASFFKAIFLLSGVVVLLLAADSSPRLGGGITEYYALVLFALAGMCLAASANDFSVMYVALELITVTFYVLTSFERSRAASLEAGVKYLILGALSSGFLVYGIALAFGASGTMSFDELAKHSPELASNRLFQLGVLMIFGGLSFKIAVFPFQVWAPDVYEGAPVPTTAFLAIGSKAAGVVLLVRLFGFAVPDLALHWEPLWMTVAGVSILYGSLCAIPQRGLRRLLGYSSIANGGFVMVALSTMSKAGSAAVLFYLAGYLFTVLAAFLVVGVLVHRVGKDDFSVLAGLHHRSPLLAAVLAASMISLAGVPPLAGFFGKFVVLRAVVEQGAASHAYFWLAAVAIVGVVISFWYYFGVIRAMYWGGDAPDLTPIPISPTLRGAMILCLGGILCLGVFPSAIWEAAVAAVAGLGI